MQMAGRGHIAGFLLLIMVPMSLLSSSSSSQAAAKEFNVGGKDGWVVKPSENYNHWAERNMFQVNDTLYFNYKKGNDSVLVVKKEDYDSCNINNPVYKMEDGNSTFHLDKTGLFYFISGNVDNCKNDQKLIILVMAIKHQLSESPATALPRTQQIHSYGMTPTTLTNDVETSVTDATLKCYPDRTLCLNLPACFTLCKKQGWTGSCLSRSGSDFVCCCKMN